MLFFKIVNWYILKELIFEKHVIDTMKTFTYNVIVKTNMS